MRIEGKNDQIYKFAGREGVQRRRETHPRCILKARGRQGHEHLEIMLDASSLILSVKQNVDEQLIRVIDRGNDSAWIKT
jgi:hypothetical protein